MPKQKTSDNNKKNTYRHEEKKTKFILKNKSQCKIAAKIRYDCKIDNSQKLSKWKNVCIFKDDLCDLCMQETNVLTALT